MEKNMLLTNGLTKRPTNKPADRPFSRDARTFLIFLSLPNNTQKTFNFGILKKYITDRQMDQPTD